MAQSSTQVSVQTPYASDLIFRCPRNVCGYIASRHKMRQRNNRKNQKQTQQMKQTQHLFVATLALALFAQTAQAQGVDHQVADEDSITPYAEQHLEGVEVTRRRSGTTRMGGAVNGTLINQEELFKAACCNLGESFVTNPSADAMRAMLALCSRLSTKACFM